jgi:hypothetical protein
VSELEWRTAYVRVNNNYDWILRVKGTDICELLYRDRDPDLEPFPGAEIGDCLIRMGWTPDRHYALLPTGASSTVERMRDSMYAGWRQKDKTRRSIVWTLPCYRRKR